MRMGDFGGVYLVKFIHLRAFYMIFEDVHAREWTGSFEILATILFVIKNPSIWLQMWI